jgi:hypothetical protein
MVYENDRGEMIHVAFGSVQSRQEKTLFPRLTNAILSYPCSWYIELADLEGAKGLGHTPC